MILQRETLMAKRKGLQFGSVEEFTKEYQPERMGATSFKQIVEQLRAANTVSPQSLQPATPTITPEKIATEVKEEAKEKEMAERKEQVGSGDRSGRIRTYNFPQNRISDHRINLTLYRLDEIMQGGVMDDIIEPLIADAQAKIMEQNGL